MYFKSTPSACPATSQVFCSPSGETYGAEPNPTGNPIGGGDGYTRIISPTDPSVKYVVSTKDQLFAALKSAQSGEVIFVKSDANIDLTGTYNTVIPAGVTLASDRGSNGSPGGRIFRYRLNPPSLEKELFKMSTLVVGGDNVRITGLRIEGNDTVQDELFEDVGLEVMSAIEADERTGLEVDNCEIWGWSHAGVYLVNLDWSAAHASIHHNYIHHCQARGYGYGIDVRGGTALIEANLFDYTRHAISGKGVPGEGYEARYNIHLGHGSAMGGHHFDVHPYQSDETSQPIAGNEYKIHHNTFELTDMYSVGIRAVPEKGVWIDHNIFKNANPPVFQKGPAGYGRIFMTDNLVGSYVSNHQGVLGSNLSLYAEGPIALK
jgi:hypothetical protein